MRPKGYKCSNVKCDSCVGHSMCGELGDAAMNCVDRITTRQTNADRIRAMSDEELAKYLYQMQKNILRYVATVIGYSEEFDFADEAPDLLEWLQQSVKENDYD